MVYVSHLLTFTESNSILAVGFNLILLLVSGISTHLLCKFLLIKMVRKVLFNSHKQDVPPEKNQRTTEKLSNFVLVITVYCALQFMSVMSASLVTTISTIYGILFFTLMSVFFNEMLDIVNSSYLRKTKHKNHSTKDYVQIGRILIHVLVAVMVLIMMSNKSPTITISSLGAVAAVPVVVFQHALLSLVANVQPSLSGVLQLGGWIEMPDKGLNGEVTDTALHIITIHSWGNVISHIPTKNFLTEIYTNWQTMFSSGARRVMRSIVTDRHSVHFFDQKVLSSMLTIRGVNEPLGTLLDGRDPGGVADHWFADNGLTNLTLLRHYLMHYLAERPDTIKEMYVVAKTLKPSSSGIPLETYYFIPLTLWKDYEDTQSAIFEHVTTVVRQFPLRLYQYPAGHGFQRLSQGHAARTGLPSPAEG